MVKPSLKMTSFKHHPVYVQKSMHMDYPFYGPKLQYQRAEVIPGGDCETVTDVWREDAADWLVIQSDDPRVGSNSILMTKSGILDDSSIYLLLSNPIDLSWAKFVGFWYKGAAGEIYAANDIYLYIFTRSANYAYANRARRVDPIGGYTEKDPAVWHYAEVDFGDFLTASGYFEDKLDEVWGIGFCAHGIGSGQTMNVDQIEFYTVGTGLGPARGLIMSAPLYDDAHAERGYGLAWNEYSGRIEHSLEDDYAFAGICTGNPTRTRLSLDASGTTLHVVDASLLKSGVAIINDDSVIPMEDATITEVNVVTETVTLSAAPAAFTTDENAYICMKGDEEGTIRVDFMVDGVVNLEAAQAVLLGYGCTCAAAGTALTVNQAAIYEEGQIIGKTITAASGIGEVFPVKLMTTALSTWHGSAELLGNAEIRHSTSAELLGKAVIRQVGTPAELLGEFETQGVAELLCTTRIFPL